MYCWNINALLFFILVVIFIIAVIFWAIVASRNQNELSDNDLRMLEWARFLMFAAIVLGLIIIIVGAYGAYWFAEDHAHKYYKNHHGDEHHGKHVEHRETATSVSF